MEALLDDGKIDELLRKLAPFKDRTMSDGVLNFYTYAENHKDYMSYGLYKSKRYFVGSGIIETGNKQLMQNRMKLQGMRWQKENAQQMLSLKAKYESGLWDEMIPIILKDLHENHQLPAF